MKLITAEKVAHQPITSEPCLVGTPATSAANLAPSTHRSVSGAVALLCPRQRLAGVGRGASLGSCRGRGGSDCAGTGPPFTAPLALRLRTRDGVNNLVGD